MKEDNMKRKHWLSALGILLLMAGSLFAQDMDKRGTLVSLEFQKIRRGMQPQYEAGRKQKAAWHKQQNDPLPLLVWQTLSGEQTGDFIVGRFGQHWADLDKPAVTDEADIAEFEKVMGSYVESVVARYYDFMPKISNSTLDGPAKFSEILTFHVRSGKISDFRSAITRIYDASKKTNWPITYEWYELSNGGDSGTFVLALPHKSWAEFEDKPDVKPYREMLKEAFGQAEADSIVDRIDRSVERETSEILQFRPDLSYMPAK
jgi:hypothetical protein